MEIVLISLLFLSFQGIIAEDKVLISKIQCETNYSSYAWYDEESQICTVKIGNIDNEAIVKLLYDQSIKTPLKVRSGFSGSGYSEYTNAYVHCPPHQTASLNRKTCESSKKWKESCTIITDKDYLDNVPYSMSSAKIPISNCDFDAGLECNKKQGICECGKGEYNAEHEYCYSRQDCKRLMYDSNYDPVNNICVYPLNQRFHRDYENRYSPSFPCPQNSELVNTTSFSFICTCLPGFEISEDGKSCLEAISYNGSCSGNNKDACSKIQGLECGKNETCHCRENSAWNPREEKCRLPAYKECTDSCIDNNDSFHCQRNPHLSCGKNSKCTGEYYKSCSCDTKYSSSQDGLFCYGQEFAKCQDSKDCEKKLSCIDGFCRCPNLLGQKYIYNAGRKQCRLLPGFKCKMPSLKNLKFWDKVYTKAIERMSARMDPNMRQEDDPRNPCMPKSACLEGQCVCSNGTSMSADRECLINFGSQCDHGKCNIDEGLGCINGICSCIGTDLEFVEGKGCLAPIGFPCGYNAAAGTSRLCSGENCDTLPKYFVKCQAPAVCESIKDGISLCKEKEA